MNTHETYVSLETAKLLKQAGFDWSCRGYYDRQTLRFNFVWDHNGKGASTQCSAPTLDVAQRWLREVRRHDVFVFPCNGLYFYTVRKYYHEGKVDYFDCPNKDAFDTYEESQETGIKKCLEIILNEDGK